MERLTTHDLMMLWPDDLGWPEDLGALAILDGSELFDVDGRFRIELVRAAIARRLHLVPRFRQRLCTPRRGLGRPLWVDAQEFDVADHVLELPLAAPGGEHELLAAVGKLHAGRLDRSRPLWAMWLLTGMSGGRVGLFVKTHHTIADGVAAVALLGKLLDERTEPPAPTAPGWQPQPLPSDRDLLRDNAHWRALGAGRMLAKLGHPVTVARQTRDAWSELREVMSIGHGAARTSINRVIGPQRKVRVVRGDLGRLKEAARAHGATVNDVLLVAVARGLDDLLRSRGERVDGELRAFVPISLHQERSGGAEGNQDSAMIVPLPFDEPDPVRGLERIAAHTALQKRRHRPATGALLPLGVMQRAAWRIAAHQRSATVSVTNIPGPSRPLHLAAAVVREVFPLPSLTGNLTLGVGALSYAGQFNITAVADQDACPDVDVFVTGVTNTLRQLDFSPTPSR